MSAFRRQDTCCVTLSRVTATAGRTCGFLSCEYSQLGAQFFSMFISFLYIFRATMCPSSEEVTVSMRHLVCVTLCG